MWPKGCFIVSPPSNTSSCFPAWCPFFLCYLLTRAFRNSARSSRVRSSGLEERKHFDNAERPRPFDCQSRRCACATTLQIAIVFRSCMAEKIPFLICAAINLHALPCCNICVSAVRSSGATIGSSKTYVLATYTHSYTARHAKK